MDIATGSHCGPGDGHRWSLLGRIPKDRIVIHFRDLELSRLKETMDIMKRVMLIVTNEEIDLGRMGIMYNQAW